MSGGTARVLLVGALPPPVGGITVHLERFLARPPAGVDLAVLDLRKRCLTSARGTSRRLADLLRAFAFADLVHIHVSSQLKLLVALAARLLGKRVVYTHHNNVIARPLLFRLLFRLCHHVIFVNDRCIPAALHRPCAAARWSVVPAFIPPAAEAALPSWLEQRLDGFDHLVVTNCSRLAWVEEGETYGFDLLVAAFHRLEAQGRLKGTAFVFLDPSGEYAGRHGLGEGGRSAAGNALVYVGGQALSFPALLRRARVSVRATRTDGDSLSVRESLFHGVPVVASDVVSRPEGCRLFATGDAADLAERLAEALQQRDGVHDAPFDATGAIAAIYARLLSGRMT